jgi:aminopeptidase
MIDPRMTRLAEVLVGYSTKCGKGDKILIEAIDVPHEFAAECARVACQRGAHPLIMLKSKQIDRALMLNGTKESWDLIADVELLQMKGVDCYLGARGTHNSSELSDVPNDKQNLWSASVWKRVHVAERVNNTRWCVIRWPSPSMAQDADMSTEAFEDFYFNVCTLDYGKMAEAMQALKKRLEATDQVHIKGPQDTDLKFSIKGLPAIPCAGSHNIPDGEVFTAPVRESVNGVMHYNTKSVYRGTTHEDIRFEFKNGKIIKATSSSTDKLNEVLDTDEGARYIGEFAIGFNPYILHPMKDTLFDEKICGSIHFTPGGSYDECPNGNKSEVHWDIVLIQRPDYGGGELHFDGELVRKDGLFVVDDLKPLNPENLK